MFGLLPDDLTILLALHSFAMLLEALVVSSEHRLAAKDSRDSRRQPFYRRAIMLSTSLVLVGLASLACATPLSQQQPFFSSHQPVVALTDEHDDLLFVQSQPVDSPFTYHITHEKFPGHQVRIREPKCAYALLYGSSADEVK